MSTDRDTFYNGETGMTESLPPLTDRIAAAYNRAADDVIGACELDGGVVEVINLVLNAGLHYFNHPNATLDAAIDANYGLESDEEGPIEWIKEDAHG